MARAKPSPHERRVFGRQFINARVRLVHSTIGEVNGRTMDISDSGVFVAISPLPKLPIGAHIKMHMLDSSQPKIAFNMKVVRNEKHGFGLMFIDYELNGERFTMDALRKHWHEAHLSSKN